MGNRTKKPSTSLWVVAGVAVAVVAVLIGGSLYSSRSKGPNQAVVSDAQMGAQRNVLGKVGAKVTVVEFNDYL